MDKGHTRVTSIFILWDSFSMLRTVVILTRMSPTGFVYLNIWSLVDGTVWESDGAWQEEHH